MLRRHVRPTGLLSALALLLVGLPARALADTCGEYADCSSCLHPKDPALNCGWCSPTAAVSIPSMTPLTRCMDHTSKGWLCPDLYMKDGCVAGYVCNATSGTCALGAPGEGGHKDVCEASCHAPAPPAPKQYVCNATTLTCEPASRRHGGQPTKDGCAETCGKKAPSELLGLWRGLDIQVGFTTGEWVMNFSDTAAVAWGPIGSPRMYEASVAQIGPQRLELTMTAPPAAKGQVRLATYSNAGWPTGPETWSFSIAIQRESTHIAPPPTLPSDAIGDDVDLYVFHGCHEYNGRCNFAAAFRASAPDLSWLYSGLQGGYRVQGTGYGLQGGLNSDGGYRVHGDLYASVADAHKCSAHTSCGMCINDASSVCGWCDGVITFSDGTTCGEDGKGCCGGSVGFAKCNPGYRKACPVVCDWQTVKPAGKHPFCREATTKEFNSTMSKYADCAALNASRSCDIPPYGQYCDRAAKQCKQVKTKGECIATPGCNATHPTCASDCVEKRITFCDPDAGCQGPVSKAECALNPHCNADKPGCNPNQCSAPEWYTCDLSQDQCIVHQGKRPGPGSIYFNRTDDCKRACINHDVSGVWRGLRVDDGFTADEWDFAFTEATRGSAVVFKSKSSGVKYAGTYAIGAALTSEPYGAYEIAISLASGESLKGLLSSSNSNGGGPAQGPFTRFLYLGLPLASLDTAVSFDDAMKPTKQEFVLTACLPSEAKCDFSAASPAR